MRIISGTLKARNIFFIKNTNISPTTDYIRENIFNTIPFYIEHNNNFLDLYSGSGSISYEAASRGFKHIISVDSSQIANHIITNNIAIFKLNNIITHLKLNVNKFLANKYYQKIYNVIFIDPPYDYNESLILDHIKILYKCNYLDQGTLIIIERRYSNISLLMRYSDKYKKYGSTIIYYLTYRSINNLCNYA